MLVSILGLTLVGSAAPVYWTALLGIVQPFSSEGYSQYPFTGSQWKVNTSYYKIVWRLLAVPV